MSYVSLTRMTHLLHYTVLRHSVVLKYHDTLIIMFYIRRYSSDIFHELFYGSAISGGSFNISISFTDSQDRAHDN